MNVTISKTPRGYAPLNPHSRETAPLACSRIYRMGVLKNAPKVGPKTHKGYVGQFLLDEKP